MKRIGESRETTLLIFLIILLVFFMANGSRTEAGDDWNKKWLNVFEKNKKKYLITDLTATAAEEESVVLVWSTPPFYKGKNKKLFLQLKYSPSPITQESLKNDPAMRGSTIPQFQTSQKISNLPCDSTYYFAIKTGHDVSRLAGLSNRVSVKTKKCTPKIVNTIRTRNRVDIEIRNIDNKYTWSSVSVGKKNSAAIKSDGTLWEWNNEQEFLAQIGTSTDWTAISASGAINLAKKKDGSLWGWGGQFSVLNSNYGKISRFIPSQIGSDTDWKKIAAGAYHAIALKYDGSLWKGSANRSDNIFPALTSKDTHWSNISANENHFVGIKKDGTLIDGSLYEWEKQVKVKLPGVKGAKEWASVSAGCYHTVALKKDGTLWGWAGNVGIPKNKKFRFIAKQIGTENNWLSVSTGCTRAVGIKKDGSLWMLNTGFLLQHVTKKEEIMLHRIGTGTDWASVSIGSGYMAAIRKDGTLWSIGGSPRIQSSIKPIPVTNEQGIVMISSGDNHTVVLKKDGTLHSLHEIKWSKKNHYQVRREYQFKTKQIGTDNNWSFVTAGDKHTIAIKKNGSLWAWGKPFNLSPTQLGVDFDWDYAASTEGFTIGLKKNGSLRKIQKTDKGISFEPIMHKTGWGAAISVGYDKFSKNKIKHHLLAVKKDGTLWAWGNNTFGQLGDGTFYNKKNPVQIGFDTDWSQVFAGYRKSAAIKKDGSLWIWGENFLASPIIVTHHTDWADLNIKKFIAIKKDGTLWEIRNKYNKSVAPHKIGNASAWAFISEGFGRYTFAVKKNGTLWSWGNDFDYCKNSQKITTGKEKKKGKEFNTFASKSSYLLKLGETLLLDQGISMCFSQAKATKSIGGHKPGFGVMGEIILKITKEGEETKYYKFKNFVMKKNIFDTYMLNTFILFNKDDIKDNLLASIHMRKIVYGPPAPDMRKKIEIMQGKNILTKNGILIKQVAAGGKWRDLSQNGYHVAAILEDGTLWDWHRHSPNSRYKDKETAFQISKDTDWKKVFAGRNYSIAIKENGTLWVWGYRAHFNLTLQDKEDWWKPVQIGKDTNWEMVYTGDQVTIALKEDGTLWEWRRPKETGDNPKYPLQIGKEKNWTSFAVGFDSMLALKSDGSLWIMYLRKAQLPKQVGYDKDWVQASVGKNHYSAIKKDGTLWTWGENFFNQLGDGTQRNKKLPMQIGVNTYWKYVSLSGNKTLAITQDDSMWFWGEGLGDTPQQEKYINRWIRFLEGKDKTIIKKTDNTFWEIKEGIYSPVQLGKDKNWKAISAGGRFVLAIRQDGTLWKWQQGNNTYYPVQIGTDSDWAVIFAGADPSHLNYSVAIKKDNTLWRVDNDNIPYKIGLDNDWLSASRAGDYTFLLKQDGTMWRYIALGKEFWRLHMKQVGNDSGWTDISYKGRPYTKLFGIKKDKNIWSMNIDKPFGKSSTVENAKNWKAVSGNSRLWLFLKKDGTLWMKKNKFSGSEKERYTPLKRIGKASDWEAISSGVFHYAAIKKDHTLWEYGSPLFKNIASEFETKNYIPIQVGFSYEWETVSAGRDITAALKTDGTLWVWGKRTDTDRRRRYSSSLKIITPVKISKDSGWLKILSQYSPSHRGTHSLGLKKDGSMWTWGHDTNGQLGIGTIGEILKSPVQIGSDMDWTDIYAGKNHSMAVKSDGTLWHWGAVRKNLSNRSSGNLSTPQQIGNENNWKIIRYPLAIKKDDTLWNLSNQIKKVGIDSDWLDVRSNQGAYLGLKKDGSLWYKSGTRGAVKIKTPKKIGNHTRWSSFSAGGYVAGALKEDKTFWVWNDPFIDTLSFKNSSVKDISLPVENLAKWSLVSSGSRFTVAIKKDGTLWVWEKEGIGEETKKKSFLELYNDYRILSQERVSFKVIQAEKPPVCLSTDTDWTAASAGTYHFIALKRNGTLWAMGKNNFSQLGMGKQDRYWHPLSQIGTDKDWVNISAGSFHNTAVKQDGSLWAWGANNAGQLGSNSFITNIYPVKVGIQMDWHKASSGKGYAGRGHTAALKKDGSLWIWGNEIPKHPESKKYKYSTKYTKSPVQVGAEKNWRDVSAGGLYTVAVKQDGSLWEWGGRNKKQVPTRIGKDTDWEAVSAGRSISMAKKRDGSLWIWGRTDKNFTKQKEGEWSFISDSIAVKKNGAIWDWKGVYGNIIREGYAQGLNFTSFSSTVALEKDGTIWSLVNELKQIGTGSDWQEVFDTGGIKKDGTLWEWRGLTR